MIKCSESFLVNNMKLQVKKLRKGKLWALVMVEITVEY